MEVTPASLLPEFNGRSRWVWLGLGAAVAVLVSWGGYSVWESGESDSDLTEEEVRANAQAKFNAAYAQLPASSKLEVQYMGKSFNVTLPDGTRATAGNFNESTEIEGHGLKGLDGLAENDEVYFHFSSDCLADSGYSTLPIVNNGFWETTESPAPSNFYIKDGIVHLAAPSAEGTLRFRKEGVFEALVPADNDTRDTLIDEGCAPDYNPVLNGPHAITDSSGRGSGAPNWPAD